MNSKIKIIRNSGRFLTQIQSLWRRSSKTLGFFTEGAFQEYSSKNQILVAIDNAGRFYGYLLFRIANYQVVIVHLCVEESAREKGIAKLLMAELDVIGSQYGAVTLKCRRDFNASKLWPKIGFTASADVIGRSKDGHLLTQWRKDYGAPNLFSAEAEKLLKENLCVAIDANVFFGLSKDSDSEDEESKLLTSDWLPDSLELMVTDEIRNEINRNSDPEKRKVLWRFASSFPQVRSNLEQYDRVHAELVSFAKVKKTQSSESDIRQVCKCICGGVKYFITRDEGILKLHDEVFERFGVSIFRPSDLILHLDELQNGSDYQPFQLASTAFQMRLIRAGELNEMSKHFISPSEGENRATFSRSLRAAILPPDESRCDVCFAGDSTPVALLAQCGSDPATLEVPIFRVRHPRLSRTIIRHLILRIKLESAKSGKFVTIISDKCLSAEMREILIAEGFHSIGDGFCKINVHHAGTIDQIEERMKAILDAKPDFAFASQFIPAVRIELGHNRIDQVVLLEKQIWPGKFLDLGIPCFIIPIRPYYASQLFDEKLASQDLLGASELILNRELIYYRGAKPKVLSAPGRILWYVSMDDKYQGAGGIRACSYLDDVQVGRPKFLFRKFRRLGIYRWDDVFRTAGRDTEKELMAIKFSETTLLDTPIAWSAVQKILEKNQIRNNIQSPIRIPPEVFAQIHEAGFHK